MTLDEFKVQFDRMALAFSVAKQQDKAKIYFEELQKIDGQLFKAIVTAWIQKGHRFPSIAELLEVRNALSPYQAPERATCGKCDGKGWVKIGMQMYRGDCEHGERLSKTIRLAKAPAIELQNQQQELSEIYGEAYAQKMYPEAF